jgi:hypothetical protein
MSWPGKLYDRLETGAGVFAPNSYGYGVFIQNTADAYVGRYPKLLSSPFMQAARARSSL